MSGGHHRDRVGGAISDGDLGCGAELDRAAGQAFCRGRWRQIGGAGRRHRAAALVVRSPGYAHAKRSATGPVGSCRAAARTRRRSPRLPPRPRRAPCRSRRRRVSSSPGIAAGRASRPRAAEGAGGRTDAAARDAVNRRRGASSVGWRGCPTTTNGDQANTNTMSEPRKYGYVCQLLVKNSSEVERQPDDGGRTRE